MVVGATVVGEVAVLDLVVVVGVVVLAVVSAMLDTLDDVTIAAVAAAAAGLDEVGVVVDLGLICPFETVFGIVLVGVVVTAVALALNEK